MSLLLLLSLLACRSPDDPTDSGAVEGDGGSSEHDLDGDGYVDADQGGDDCDDRDAAVHPGADELCNGHDDDCDEDVDEASAVDATTWYLDLDGDDYGVDDSALALCDRPDGYVDTPGDCADDDAGVNPGADELCNGIDDDCDGDTDESSAVDAPTWYADVDEDGYGDPDAPAPACSQPDGYVENDRDCADDDGSVHPDQLDAAGNGVDDDCDGGIDEVGVDLDTAATPLAGPAGTGFGAALALDPAGSQLLIGAPDGDAGSAWLIQDERSLELTGQSDGDQAGAAVALVDMDGDGFEELLVGAPTALTTGTDAGAVYLLAGPLTAGGGLNALRQAKLKAEDAYDWLGSSLAGGPGLVAIGASNYDHDGAGPRSGAAYVVDQLPEGSVDINSVALARIAGSTGGASLGASLAFEDLDGDGLRDLLLGAPGDSRDDLDDLGAAWLWAGPLSGALTVEDGLGLWGASEADQLGTAVAAVGDLDGDGLGEVAVGVPGDDAGGEDAGAVLVLPGATDGKAWEPLATLLGEAAGARSGSGLAGGHDLDGDGRPDLVVTAEGAGTTHLVVDDLDGTFLLGSAAASLYRDEATTLVPTVGPSAGILLGQPDADTIWFLDPATVLP